MPFNFITWYMLMSEIIEIFREGIDCGKVKVNDGVTFDIFVLPKSIRIGESLLTLREVPDFATKLSWNVPSEMPAKLHTGHCSFNLKLSFNAASAFDIVIHSTDDCNRVLRGHETKIESSIEKCIQGHLSEASVKLNTKTKKPMLCGSFFIFMLELARQQKLEPLITTRLYDFLDLIKNELSIPNLELPLDVINGKLSTEYGSIWNIGEFRRPSNVSVAKIGKDCTVEMTFRIPSAVIKWECYELTGNQTDWGENLIIGLSNITVWVTLGLDIHNFPCGIAVKNLKVGDGLIDLSEESEVDEHLRPSIMKALQSTNGNFFQRLSVDMKKSLSYGMGEMKCITE